MSGVAVGPTHRCGSVRDEFRGALSRAVQSTAYTTSFRILIKEM
jgi:hypothetical protein